MDPVSVVEVADTLGIRPRDVYALIDAGDLPAYRLDGRVVIDRPDLQRVLPPVLTVQPSPGRRAWTSATERIEALEGVLTLAHRLRARSVAAMRDEGASWEEIEQFTGWSATDLRDLAGGAGAKDSSDAGKTHP